MEVTKCMECPHGGVWYLENGRVVRVECTAEKCKEREEHGA